MRTRKYGRRSIGTSTKHISHSRVTGDRLPPARSSTPVIVGSGFSLQLYSLIWDVICPHTAGQWGVTEWSSGIASVMGQNTQRTSFHADPKPDPGFSPLHIDYRTELNNWPQVNGGPGALVVRVSGSDLRATQSELQCASELPCEPSFIVLTLPPSLRSNGSRAEANTLSAEEEEAARNVLRIFQSDDMANTSRFAFVR